MSAARKRAARGEPLPFRVFENVVDLQNIAASWNVACLAGQALTFDQKKKKKKNETLAIMNACPSCEN
jgi:hypothetical protein